LRRRKYVPLCRKAAGDKQKDIHKGCLVVVNVGWARKATHEGCLVMPRGCRTAKSMKRHPSVMSVHACRWLASRESLFVEVVNCRSSSRRNWDNDKIGRGIPLRRHVKNSRSMQQGGRKPPSSRCCGLQRYYVVSYYHNLFLKKTHHIPPMTRDPRNEGRPSLPCRKGVIGMMRTGKPSLPRWKGEFDGSGEPYNVVI